MNRVNEGDRYGACSNPTSVILKQSTLALVIFRTNKLRRTQYQAPLPIIIPKTTLVGLEHALWRSPSFSRFTLIGKRILSVKNPINTWSFKSDLSHQHTDLTARNL